MRGKELTPKRPALSGAERQARRMSGRTPEQVDKERADVRVSVAVLARNASWPDNPRSAVHRAAQDLLNTNFNF